MVNRDYGILSRIDSKIRGLKRKAPIWNLMFSFSNMIESMYWTFSFMYAPGPKKIQNLIESAVVFLENAGIVVLSYLPKEGTGRNMVGMTINTALAFIHEGFSRSLPPSESFSRYFQPYVNAAGAGLNYGELKYNDR